MGINNYIKNTYKNILVGSILVASAVMGTGCTLASSETIEIIYAPQVHTSFENDPNAPYYRNSRYFIYDKNDVLIRDTILNYENAEELPDDFITNKSTETNVKLSADKQSQIIFKGLPEGDYRLVVFHNAENCKVIKTQAGVSKATELRVIPTSTVQLADDHIFTSSGTVKLLRGEKTMHEIKGTPMFYKINIIMTDVDEMSSPPLQPYIMLDNIRKHYTCDGISDIAEIGDNTEKIELRDEPIGKLVGTTMTNKFFDADLVELKLFEAEPKGKIGSAVINPSDYIDINSSNLPVLDIPMRYFNNKFQIMIDDWVYLDGQDAPVGG